MFTGRPSNQSVSIHIEKSQHKIQQTLTQIGVTTYTGRRIVDNTSTHKGRKYHRSTPIERNNWMSRHMNSNVLTHNNEKVWVRRHTEPNVSTYKHKLVKKSTPHKNST